MVLVTKGQKLLRKRLLALKKHGKVRKLVQGTGMCYVVVTSSLDPTLRSNKLKMEVMMSKGTCVNEPICEAPPHLYINTIPLSVITRYSFAGLAPGSSLASTLEA